MFHRAGCAFHFRVMMTISKILLNRSSSGLQIDFSLMWTRNVMCVNDTCRVPRLSSFLALFATSLGLACIAGCFRHLVRFEELRVGGQVAAEPLDSMMLLQRSARFHVHPRSSAHTLQAAQK